MRRSSFPVRNRKLQIFEVSCLGLALRGDGYEFNSNLVQLLCIHGLNCGDVEVDSWLAKRLVSTHRQMYRMS